MNSSVLSQRWLNLAGLYLLAGVSLGIGMGISGDHRLFPVHAHVNLLGWVSMALFALVMRLRSDHRLFAWHFWLYNISLPIMSIALTLKLCGVDGFEPVLGMASLGTALAIAFFVWALWRGRAT